MMNTHISKGFHPRSVFPTALVCLALSCNQNPKPAPTSEKNLAKIKANTEKETIRWEGRFFSLKKLAGREYTLVLIDSNDKKDTFITLMPLDSMEISLLKKSGNNITLTYRAFYNPVRKTNEKLVKSMIPVYGPLPR